METTSSFVNVARLSFFFIFAQVLNSTAAPLKTPLHCILPPTRTTGSNAEDLVLSPKDGLPLTPRSALFFQIAQEINLQNAKFEDGGGGMSVDLAYSVPLRNQIIFGNFLSMNRRDRTGDNVTGNPEGHIVSFNLARLLGISDIYSTGIWYKIHGNAVRALHEIADSIFAWRGDRRTNKIRVESNTAPVGGAYPTIEGSLSVYLEKKHTLRTLNGLSLDVVHAEPNGLANESNVLLKVIMKKLPKPRKGEKYLVKADKLGLVPVDAFQAAKDLSTLFLIDSMLGQGDRFSGGNIDLIKTSSGSYRIASLDNGAAALPRQFLSYADKYLQWTQRVDPLVAEEILRLDYFLHCGGEYLGFHRSEALMGSLGLKIYQKSFKANVRRTAEHVRRLLRNEDSLLRDSF